MVELRKKSARFNLAKQKFEDNQIKFLKIMCCFFFEYEILKKCEKTREENTQNELCQVGWCGRIHRLHLCKEVRHPNECPVYDSKQFDGKVSVMLEP